MSIISISPKNECVYEDLRRKDIIFAILSFYRFVEEYYDKIEEDDKKCLIFEDDGSVVLFFPFVPPADMTSFSELISDDDPFKYLGSDHPEELNLCISNSYPEVPPETLVLDYLGGDYDEDMIMEDIMLENMINVNAIIPITINNTPMIVENEDDDELHPLEKGSMMMSNNPNEFKASIRNRMLLKLSELAEYKEIKSNCENVLSNALYECLVYNVVFCGNWWHYDNEKGIWKADDGVYVWNTLSSIFITTLRLEETSENETLIGEVIRYLGSEAARSRVRKDLSQKLSWPEFSQKINSKRNLIGMKNGTYDLETATLEKSVPADFISIKCKIRYISDPSEKDIFDLMAIIKQIFPKQEVFEFFLRSCSSMLEGYNKHKVFYCWWGKGHNAKTLMQRFITEMFGEYAAALPTSLITGKRSGSSEATPDMQYAKNKLVVFLQEPNPDEKIQVGRVKEMTGNDKIYVRALYKGGESMEFKAKIVLVSNNILEAPGMDTAFRDRLLVIPFESVFSNDPNAHGLYKFPRDGDMEEKIFKYKETFMRILLSEYSLFKEYGLQTPEYISQITSEYVLSNNYPLKFIRSKIYKDNSNDIQLIDVYSQFKEWFGASYPGRATPNITVFSTELRNEGYEEKDGLVLNANVNSYM